MNHIVRLDEARAPRSPASMPESIVLGMPHLTASGLSEGWLLRELGHRHWLLLAAMAGMAVPDFRDTDGEPVYAAFSALSIRDAAFGEARENDVLTLSSEIARVSRTQVMSRHRLALQNRPIGTVELVSAFVRRAAGGGNHAVARVALGGLPPVEPGAAPGGLAALAAAFRHGRVGAHLGFALGRTAALAQATFDPCPSQDFNGAGFLYFTSFLAFVDRAEWRFARERALSAATIRRDVFFRGNADPGETIRVVLLDERRLPGAFAHRCRIERCGDGAVIADLFSIRCSPDAAPADGRRKFFEGPARRRE